MPNSAPAFPTRRPKTSSARSTRFLEDMASGRPMDRLVCGDVGFGKTEVALRAAFAAAIEGKQVAVVVPTTLLARQHYKNFATRFAHLPVKVAQMSRMVSAADLKSAKAGAASGEVDIIVGTHAVLGKAVSFKDLGLVVIDEEQHFGVKHKERLKELRAEVHVLTLSATPIPRTFQLALTGVRELSIIATPPVDRLAVRTFISPFDDLLVREALLRERYRGGQSFYVCPRIDDLEEAGAFLRQHVPEVKFIVAHGQLAATELEARMAAFYDGQYDVLLSTAIVESGLDIPAANTLIVHRADMFGLGQLYQLRGRVGRSKVRAYALFTVPQNRTMTPQAERRLKVLHSLDTLGAGFELASHDLDIRGAGNLLGDEQSGHIKEVGYELYQDMLHEAVEALKAGIEEPAEEAWSPSITLGTAGNDTRDLCRRSQLAPEPLSASCGAAIRCRDREFRGRDDRPFRAFAGRSRTTDAIGRDQGPVPQGAYRKGRRGAERRHRCVSRQFLRQSTRLGALYRRARIFREGTAGHENRVRPRFRDGRRKARRHAANFAGAHHHRNEKGGMRRGRWKVKSAKPKEKL